jgi:hypothetical protein
MASPILLFFAGSTGGDRKDVGMTVRLLAAVTVLATLAGGPVPVAASAEEGALAASEFKLYRDYLDALEDARVQKLKQSARLAAIAKNFRVPEKKLRAAVEKAEAAGGAKAIQAKNEETLKAALAPAFGDRLKEARVDCSHGHVVTYVAWTLDKKDQLDEEAALAAARAVKAAPVTSTVALWALEGETKVYEAKISADAARNINEARIKDFADTRYRKLFEGRRNQYEGATGE